MQAAAQEAREITSLDYIDAAVLDRVKPDTSARDTELKGAKEAARTFIAGFMLHDLDKERATLDALIAKRNKSIEDFIADRGAVTKKLEALGIKPLAVVPLKAWADICDKTGLVVMFPDNEGKVTVSARACQRHGSPQAAEMAAKKDYAAYVRSLFPRQREAGFQASVVLPTPPAEVAEILFKARSLLTLGVAAVPEAIRFVQTPAELYRATSNPKDEWARRQGYADYADWVRRDPIVFHNHGTASAIIAQFGDFPIEKQIVDLVIAGNDIIPEAPQQAITAATVGGYTTINDPYLQHARLFQLELERQQQQMMAQRGLMGLATTSGTTSATNAGYGLLGRQMTQRFYGD